MLGRSKVRTGAALATSLVVHLFAVLLTRPPARAAHATDLASTFELSIVELGRREPERPTEVTAPAEPERPPAPPKPPPPQRAQPKRSERERSKPEPRVQASSPPSVSAEAQPAETERAPNELPAEQPEQPPARPPVVRDLSPSAVAGAWQGKGTLTMPEKRPPAPHHKPTPKELEARLNRHFAAAANDISYAHRRDPPKVGRRSDGNLWYEGTAFLAVITPDGTVKFSDIVWADPLPPAMRDYPPGLAPEYIEVIKRIQELLTIELPWPDLNDMVARISNDDPYAEEKRWFLRETEDMRRKMADQYRLQEVRKAKRHIVGELRGIIGNPALSPEQKRIAVFAIWDTCAGEGDEKWQQLVESFIRERMPLGSEFGYTPEVLARLNRKRNSLRDFAPYRDADALDEKRVDLEEPSDERTQR